MPLPNAVVENLGVSIVRTALRKLTKPTGSIASNAIKTTRKEANQRRHAEPIKVIRDKNTLDVVGWLYKWNTGALVPMWKDGKCTNVFFE